MLNLHDFHGKLFGQPPNGDQSRLYDSNCLGYDDGDRTNGSRLMAVLGLSLGQTLQGKTLILVPSAMAIGEVMEKLRELTRHMVRLQRNRPEAIADLRTAMKNMGVVDGVLSMYEPARWTAYGFHSGMTTLPQWLSTRLLR